MILEPRPAQVATMMTICTILSPSPHVSLQQSGAEHGSLVERSSRRGLARRQSIFFFADGEVVIVIVAMILIDFAAAAAADANRYVAAACW